MLTFPTSWLHHTMLWWSGRTQAPGTALEWKCKCRGPQDLDPLHCLCCNCSLRCPHCTECSVHCPCSLHCDAALSCHALCCAPWFPGMRPTQDLTCGTDAGGEAEEFVNEM